MQTPFAIDVSANGERRLVLLRGELDIANAASLEEAVRELCAGGTREIVVDLRGVEFIDSSGLRALLASMSVCEEHDCSYLVEQELPVAVRRLFDVAGVGGRFAYTDGGAPGSRHMRHSGGAPLP
jgi:anti-anti-sigma factor